MMTAAFRRVSAWGVGVAAGIGAIVLLSQACGQQAVSVPKAPPGIATPLAVQSPSAASPVTLAISESATDLAKPEKFQPLLMLPELAAVNAEVTAGHFARAADELERRFGGQSGNAFPGGPVRYQYLLGRLRSKAGEHEAAARAFERSSEPGFPLQEYARFEAGRSSLRAGSPERALQLLANLPSTFVFAPALLRSRAEAARSLTDWQSALNHYDELLTLAPNSDAWQLDTLAMAEAWLELKDPARRTPKVTERSIGHLRRLGLLATDRDLTKRGRELEVRLLASLSPAEQTALAQQDKPLKLAALTQLVDARSFSEAISLGEELLNGLDATERFGDLGCQAQLAYAKALAGQKKWQKATAALTEPTRRCSDIDLKARALYLAGKYAISDQRYAVAARFFEQLETEAPEHRLADDARLKRAVAYDEMGGEAEFTRLLSSIVEKYPEGDVALDGAFLLALRRLARGDWSGGAGILERALQGTRRPPLGSSIAREQYFLARASEILGQGGVALDSYEKLIREQPLSYYMLHAYSRLTACAPERAQRAVEQGLAAAEQEPPVSAVDDGAGDPELTRAIELLRFGDADWAKLELGRIDLSRRAELVWNVASLLEQAGATELGQALLRKHAGGSSAGSSAGSSGGSLSSWPAGDWRRAWLIAFPRPHWVDVQQASSRSGVEPSLVYAVMREESAFDPNAVSPSAAFGLMQLIQPTANHFGKRAGLPHSASDLRRPPVNIKLGCLVLSSYQAEFPENPLLAIPGYNAGPGRPKQWLKDHPVHDFDIWVELIPFRETHLYTKRVLASRAAYGFLYGNDLSRPPTEQETGPHPVRFEALELPLRVSKRLSVR